MTLFSALAPSYWAAGLPAMPLLPRSKDAFLKKWQRFCEEMPSEEDRADWLRAFPNHNIGLPLGAASGLVAIDIDTEVPSIRATLEQLLPPSPWQRKGRKGIVYVYRYTGQRTFRIKALNDSTIVECLSKGAQVVLPGSIHPDTGRPYEANADLWAIKDKIPALPKDIETILRQGLISSGVSLSTKGSLKVTEWVAAGARDNSMIALCGLLARDVGRGHRTLAEAFAELSAWVGNYVERVAGDPLDEAKGQQRIIEFIAREVTERQAALAKGWDAGLDPAQLAEARKWLSPESEEWDIGQLQDYIDEMFTKHDRRSPERRHAVEQALQKLAKSSCITTLDRETCLTYIANTSGRLFTVGALRKRLEEFNSGGVEGSDHTQIARLLLKEIEQFGVVRHHGSKFWQWRGSHWEQLADTRLFEIVANQFGHLPAARRHSDHKGILKVAESLCGGDLQTDTTVGLNFANGYLTSDLELRPHQPEYGSIYTLPYIYRGADAPSPKRFLSFLYQCWGKDADYEQKVQALREAIAVTLFQLAPRFQRAFCLYGIPHSGKSVLKDIITGLLPYGSISCCRPHDWADKFLPTTMFGKLANFAGELSESELIAGDRFKLIVEGEAIDGQYKGRDIFQFRVSCAHWFASNHLPRTRDSSAGFTRRWLFLTFNHAIPPAERIQGLQEEILSDERDLIAAWACAVAPQMVAANGYTIPESHERLADEMATMNNSVRYFLLAGGVKLESPPAKPSSAKVPSTSEVDLHSAYWGFSRTEARAMPVSLRVFRMRMTEMQQEFGFKILLERDADGQEVASYIGLTLVGRNRGL